MKLKRFKFNRKAMMIGFLTTMILTIIVFSFAGCITSKLLRTSPQAKENFGSFVDQVEQVYANQDLESEGVSFPLILDSQTVLAYFTSAQLVVEVDAVEKYTQYADEGGPYQIQNPNTLDFKVTMARPETCLVKSEVGEAPKGCFCLFQEVILSKAKTGEKQLSSLQAICQPIYFEVKYNTPDNNCGVGIPINVNSYQCNGGGFFIDRDVLCDKDTKLSSDEYSCYKNGRRINLRIQKVGAEVRIKEQ